MKAKIKASKNSKELTSFVNYCLKHPEESFEEALARWRGLKK